MSVEVNRVFLSGKVGQLEKLADGVIWFKLEVSKQIKEDIYTTHMPIKLKASESQYELLKQGPEILIVGGIRQTPKGLIYAVPTENWQLLSKAPSSENYTAKIEPSKPKALAEVKFKLEN